MSFDLRFVHVDPMATGQPNTPLTALQVERALADVPHLSQGGPADSPQWWYENPATGTWASFELDAAAARDAAARDSPGPAGAPRPSGLSFNLNLVVPTYFALETLPFVVRLAQRLGLGVVESGPEGGPAVDGEAPPSLLVAPNPAAPHPDLPTPPDAAIAPLLARWSAHNTAASA